jgi:glutamyl-tRNA(Gln) amidotransferase subunit D
MKQGERIEIITDSEKLQGLFVKEDKEAIFLKLPSGYNVGIAKAGIKGITGHANQKHTEETHEVNKHHDKKGLPKISLLHTGGTIASKVDYSTGAVVAQFTPEEILTLFPDLGHMANINSRLISNIMSENMRFHHYNLLAKAVIEEINDGSNGVIITHGTDFLHYTAAALSFILENVTIPVVIIGSQRSSDRPSTDSQGNLMAAANFVAKSRMKGVFVCLHEDLNDENCLVIEGVNARKMHTTRRDAFRPINKTAVARVGMTSGKIETIRKPMEPAGDFKPKYFDERLRIGMVKIHPQMFAEELKAFEGFNGLIIEGTGIGHAQIIACDDKSNENEKLKEALSGLAKKMPVAIAPQTIYGRINMNIYSPGRQLLDMGIIGNYCDMTPETAFVKLAWLVSNYEWEYNQIKELYEKNLRGEISERIEKETYLI